MYWCALASPTPFPPPLQTVVLERPESLEGTSYQPGKALTHLMSFFHSTNLAIPFQTSRHVIHTVGPRYNVRYKTAAESALYNCYRSVMQIVR